MTDQTLQVIAVIIAIISGVFGYIIRIWTTNTTDDVKEAGKENQEQAIEITELKGDIKLLQSKLDSLQAKSDTIQEKLNKISDNELVHLKADIMDIKDKNNEGHQQLFVALAEIKTLLLNSK